MTVLRLKSLCVSCPKRTLGIGNWNFSCTWIVYIWYLWYLLSEFASMYSMKKSYLMKHNNTSSFNSSYKLLCNKISYAALLVPSPYSLNFFHIKYPIINEGIIVNSASLFSWSNTLVVEATRSVTVQRHLPSALLKQYSLCTHLGAPIFSLILEYCPITMLSSTQRESSKNYF